MKCNEDEIQRVMQETGMEYIQARNHVLSRQALRSFNPPKPHRPEPQHPPLHHSGVRHR